jgi:hypothetical protein
MKIHRSASILAIAMVLAASAPLLIAQCIGPSISTDISNGPAGGKVTVSGKYFTDGCHDVCINGLCPPTLPARQVRILFLQGEKTLEVGHADANAKFELLVTVTIPADAQPGAASFVAENPETGNYRTRPVGFNVTATGGK